MDVVDRVRTVGERGDYLKQQLKDKLVEHGEYIRAHGQDLPEVRQWQWPGHARERT